MRIAIGGLHTECSTYSPVLMSEQDFRVLRGDDLPAADHFAFLKRFDQPVLPLLHARAVPGGPVRRETYEAFKAEFLQRLSACLPVQGLHLAMHGAVHVEGMDDAEADWISACRRIVGQDCVIAASYDLHGNVSPEIIDQLDIFAAYRTAPHIDVQETMERAFSMLLTALKTGTRPGIAYAPVPVLLPGEKTSTEDEPARSLYARLPEIDRRPGILDSNLMVGYVWADEARATAAAIVTGTESRTTQAAAEELANAYFAARRNFAFGPVTGALEDMLDRVESTTTFPVILADSGDNPTGGGVGDRADILQALMGRNFHNALIAGITDRPAVEACFAAGAGTTLRLSIGASLDPTGRKVNADATIIRLDPGSGLVDAQAVVQIGGIQVVLAARRRPYHNISDFAQLQLDPRTARLLVVKSGYLSPELAPIANPNLMALTDGVVNQDIAALPSHNRVMPVYPFVDDFDFVAKSRLSKRWVASGN